MLYHQLPFLKWLESHGYITSELYWVLPLSRLIAQTLGAGHQLFGVSSGTRWPGETKTHGVEGVSEGVSKSIHGPFVVDKKDNFYYFYYLH